MDRENKMDYIKKVEEILSEAVTEKTFSLEIIEKIKSLRDGFETSVKELESNKVLIESLREMSSRLEVEKNNLQSKLSEYERREKEIIESEKKFGKLNYELDFQKQRASEIKELVSLVFRNPVITTHKTGNYPFGVDNCGNPRSAYGDETETKTLDK